MSSKLRNPISLPDIQSSGDNRKIAIDKVGVTAVQYPIRFASDSESETSAQPTVATFDLFVSLPADRKGTHMSRFLQLLRDGEDTFSLESLPEFCQSIRERLDSVDASLKVRFPYFIKRLAPVSQEQGLVQLDVAIDVQSGGKNDLVLTVAGPATSLCPCSKQISARGAHNQRCELTVSVRCKPNATITIEELFDIMEQSASTQIYPVLKRPDEKKVTEDAYDNPKFVEDIVRDLSSALGADDRLTWYRCSSENFESIHQHNAFAEIER